MAPTVQRAAAPTMYNIDHHDDIWGLEAKEEVFNAWDPAKPRDYENFNPFERNLDGGVCDTNGWCEARRPLAPERVARRDP